MILLISIGIIIVGLIFKKYYHNGIFHNSIYVPIIVLGGLMLVMSIIYEVSTLHSAEIYELNEEQIEEVKVTKSYEEKLLLRKGYSNIIGYIEIQVSLTSGENLYAELYKTQKGYIFNQNHKFLFMYIPDKSYIVSDRIELAF